MTNPGVAKVLERSLYDEREAARALPQTCPYACDQISSHDWLPVNRHGLVDDLDERDA